MEECQDQNDSTKFRVNRDLIHSVDKIDQALELQELDITVYDHSTLERGIINQVKDALDKDQSEEEEGEIKDDDPDDIEPPSQTLRSSNERDVDAGSSNDTLLFLDRYLKKQSELASKKRFVKKKEEPVPAKVNVNGFQEDDGTTQISKLTPIKSPIKRKSKPTNSHEVKKRKPATGDSTSCEKNLSEGSTSGSEYNPNEDESSDDEYSPRERRKKTEKNLKYQAKVNEESDSSWDSLDEEQVIRRKSKKELDDGDLDIYLKRSKSLARLDEDDCTSLDLHYRIPNCIWDKLFKYQQQGVEWLWRLHKESYGGILGDEMGLGKTIQMISFLAGLHFSDERDSEFDCHGLGPTIIVCPTTIMHQWVREFHTWYPHVRVAILHESGTFSGKSRKQLIKSISSKTKGILITSYSGLIQNKNAILECAWHYVILDEGHKIRNPEAQVTSVCKSFDTTHKIILSGSPMQNNLKELWSLFDFIIPGKLGSINVFTASFVTPIVQGGYVNASKTQVLTAFKCATALRDTIKPFLLRRSKLEVDIQLPGKKEQVLFCKLTDDQREAYLSFLRTLDLDYVQNNKGRLFGALVTLRKICNHPDLYTSLFNQHYTFRDTMFENDKGREDDYGYWKRSGKMIVLVNLLKHWEKIGGQKVLIFTQGKKMMLVLENFIKRSGYKYLKLDGGISIGARQPLIDKFNKDSSYFIMLLTTRVGGLGVNLTGANKVIIFDPDWNPATDAQARERAWRIGQAKNVCIYRLLTTGTIEEKMYHRQIFKEFLSNKILKDPKQRRFFKANDLMELFTLNETVRGGTSETAAIFAGTGSEIKYDPRAAAKLPMKKVNLTSDIPQIVFSEKKVEEMRKIAQEMSKRFVDLANKNKIISVELPSNSDDTKKDIYGPDGQLIVKNINNTPEKNNTENSICDNAPSDCPTSKESLDSNQNVENSNTPCESLMNSSDSVRLCDASTSDNKKDNGYESDYELSFDDILANSRKDQSENDESKKVKNTSSPKEKKLKMKLKYKDKGKEKNKKNNRTKDSSNFAMFEGEIVPHLIKCKRVKKKKEEEDKEMYKNHDDYILHKLLKKSGIDTAMKHDVIMEEGPSDYAIVEEEANRIAEDAVKAIQHSYNQNRRPEVKSKNPLMQEILNKLKERNLQGVGGGPQAKALLTDLIVYLNSMGGTASTNQLVDNFRDKVDSGKSPIFKKLLSNIASFYRAPDDKGYWTIKEDFKYLIV